MQNTDPVGDNTLRDAMRYQPLAGRDTSMAWAAAWYKTSEAYEARNVYIATLPTLFLSCVNDHTAAEAYDEWARAEVIIGRRPRLGG